MPDPEVVRGSDVCCHVLVSDSLCEGLFVLIGVESISERLPKEVTNCLQGYLSSNETLFWVGSS